MKRIAGSPRFTIATRSNLQSISHLPRRGEQLLNFLQGHPLRNEKFLQRRQGFGVDRRRKRGGSVSVDVQITVTARVHYLCIEGLLLGMRSYHCVEMTRLELRSRVSVNMSHVSRQSQAVFGAHLPKTCGLEAELDQARR